MTIPLHLIVPWRQHTLRECDAIINAASGIDRSRRYMQSTLSQADTWRDWLSAALFEHKKPLTEWEENFLLSITDQLDNTGSLSAKQIAILERIYTEKV